MENLEAPVADVKTAFAHVLITGLLAALAIGSFVM
jgi:hypothetical protein